MDAYSKIRAAFEQADALILDFSYLRTKQDEALAALAELDRASKEPVGWQWMPTGHYRRYLPVAADESEWRPLYTTPPPAPVAEIDRKDYALTEIIQIAERRPDCADILTIARTARLPEKDY